MQQWLTKQLLLSLKGEGKGGGKGKGEKPNNTTTPNTGTTSVGTRPCKFYLDGTGCRNGGARTWVHDTKQLVTGNCYNCGMQGHKSPECALPRKSDAAKSGTPDPKTKGKGKGKGKGKDKPAVQAADASVSQGQQGQGAQGAPPAQASVPPTQAAASVNQLNLTQHVPIAAPPVLNRDELRAYLKRIAAMNMLLASSNKSIMQALMQSIGTSRQRIMTERNRPQVMIRKLEPSVRRTALIDSGATNNMRPAVADEASKAHPITITLADGEGEVLQLPNGTLLCSSDNQVIVSLGLLIDVLHCTSEWSPSRCIIRHPLRGLIHCEFGPGVAQ